MNNNELIKLLINVLSRAFIALCAGFIVFRPVLCAGLLPANERSDGDGAVAVAFGSGVIVFITVFLYLKILPRLLSRFQDKA